MSIVVHLVGINIGFRLVEFWNPMGPLLDVFLIPNADFFKSANRRMLCWYPIVVLLGDKNVYQSCAPILPLFRHVLAPNHQFYLFIFFLQQTQALILSHREQFIEKYWFQW